MDSRTFGDSPAAIVLADKLSTDKKNRRKVTNILRAYNHSINGIAHVETSIRIELCHLLFEKYRAQCVRLPLIIATYTDNVLSTKHRVLISRLKGNKIH